MADFTAKDVQRLRQGTGAGMMDAKKALVASDGDYEAATQWLREQGLAKASGRSDRDNSQGAVSIASDGNRIALVELKSETDFSAKGADFVTLTDELAALVAAKGPDAVKERQDDIDQLKLTKKENIDVGQVAFFEAAEGNVVDSYLHKQDGRGVVGVIIEASDVAPETLHDIALHCAFAKPSVLTREDVDAAEVEKERASLLEITKAEGKPEQAWDKIVEGRLTAWFKERALLEQGIHGEKETVASRLGDGTIHRLALAVIGE